MTRKSLADYHIAAVMPFGIRALTWLLDGRVTVDGRVVAISCYRDLERFRQRSEPIDTMLLFEGYYDELQQSDAGDAMVVIMRKTQYTIRRNSFTFRGRELPMAQAPDDLLTLLPIDIYKKGPFHHRLTAIAACALIVLITVLVLMFR